MQGYRLVGSLADLMSILKRTVQHFRMYQSHVCVLSAECWSQDAFSPGLHKTCKQGETASPGVVYSNRKVCL